MKTTNRIALSVASAVLLSLPALAAASASIDYAALYGDPTWPQLAPRAPGVTMPGPGAQGSMLHSDPTWPQTTTIAPSIALGTYVAQGSLSSIDGPSLAVRSFAALDREAVSAAVTRR